MGLAGSQARLLLLTSRQSDVEGQLMRLANQKLLLARKSSDISNEYSNALSTKNLVWITSSGSEVNMNYNLIMRPNEANQASQYTLNNTSNGKVLLDSTYIQDLELPDSGRAGDLEARMGEVTFLEKTMNVSESVAQAYINAGSVSSDDENNNNASDTYEANYYLNLYDAINASGWQTNDNLDNPEYIQNQITNGNITLQTPDSTGQWNSVSSGDTACPYGTTTDDSAVAIEEAEYNSKKDALDYQEKQIDVQITNLDTERSAVTTEIDSVKKIIDDNVKRSFKMFQA